MAEDTATATNFYAGSDFGDSIDNQKRALLASVAERGAEGAQAFKTAQAETAATRQTALNQAAARGAAINAPTSLNAELNDSYDSMSNIGLGDSALSHDREIARIGAANSAYLDQMKASGPLREEYYNAELAKIVQLQQNSGYGGSGGSGGSGDGTLAEESIATPDNPYAVDRTDILDRFANPRVVSELGDYTNGQAYLAGTTGYMDVVNSGGTREQAEAAATELIAWFIGDNSEHGVTSENAQDIMTEIKWQTQGLTSANMTAAWGPTVGPGYYTSAPNMRPGQYRSRLGQHPSIFWPKEEGGSSWNGDLWGGIKDAPGDVAGGITDAANWATRGLFGWGSDNTDDAAQRQRLAILAAQANKPGITSDGTRSGPI